LSAEDAPIIVILGSPADRDWGERISQAAERFGLSTETHIASAHKTPSWLLDMLKIWEGREPHVYITVAGRSNALSGFVDAQVTAPVIACPPPSEAFAGLDILSSLRMPRGVAPLVVLEPENAALAAAKMLGLLFPEIQTRVAESQTAERERVLSSTS
jgi:phosphoribosylaminoimidazole carboxylase PurE protein